MLGATKMLANITVYYPLPSSAQGCASYVCLCISFPARRSFVSLVLWEALNANAPYGPSLSIEHFFSVTDKQKIAK